LELDTGAMGDRDMNDEDEDGDSDLSDPVGTGSDSGSDTEPLAPREDQVNFLFRYTFSILSKISGLI